MMPPSAPRSARVVLATTARVPGGTWRHITDLATGLASTGRRVAIALPEDAHELRRSATVMGIQTTTFFETLRQARTERLLIHFHLADTYDREAFKLILRSRLSGIDVVITEHLPRTNASDWKLADPTSSRLAFMLKGAMKRIEYGMVRSVIAVSGGSRDFIIGRYRVPHYKVRVIANGIDFNRLSLPHAGGWANGANLSLLCVASLIRQKGIDVLIDAVAKSRRRWSVAVVGDGPHRPSLLRAAQQANADGKAQIELLGWVDDVDVRLHSVDALVLPSRWESFGYAALEAMAAGLPVVGTTVDGVSELIGSTSVNEASGILVEPGDAAGLALALDDLSRDPAHCRRMGENARRVAAIYSLDTMVSLTDELYRELLERRVTA